MDTRTILITGTRQVGKSTALRTAVTRLQDARARIAGLMTERTGPHDLLVTEIHTGARYPLTEAFRDLPGSPTRNFTMSDAALARSRRALREAFPTQVFVVDEIGPLELKRGAGWASVFRLLASQPYEVAILVVRLELLGEALVQLDAGSVSLIHVTELNREEVPALLVRRVLAALSGVARD